ncbi:MAG: hydrogenase nickel incorporation protein HypB [Rhodospirillales bacterium]|nr:hydrogenase nickel incorporation protein HypB [Rhodospirillales bacterium]
MCTVCGCGQGTVDGQKPHSHDHHTHDHSHDHHHGHSHDHPHSHEHEKSPEADAQGDIHFGKGIGGVHIPGIEQSRIVQIEQDILGKNDMYAKGNRQILADKGIFALNLVSSPGSGKTTLLTRTIDDNKDRQAMSVIEGDQQTSNDADRIRETGVKATQVNTGKGCHLDAHMVGHALKQLEPEDGSVLFIENVGNLVCPAAFDLGEAHKVAILSVTEGEDKPIKYPDMFHAADIMILNKTDLLPYLNFDVEKCIDYARQVKSDIRIIQLSATSGEGLEEWYEWIAQGLEKAKQGAA